MWKTRLDYQRLQGSQRLFVFLGKIRADEEPKNLRVRPHVGERSRAWKLPAFAAFTEDMTAIEILGLSP